MKETREQAWLQKDAPFPGPLAAMRRFRERAQKPLRGVQLLSTDLLVLYAIVLRVDSETGRSRPEMPLGQATLARETLLTVRGLRNALERLQQARVLVVEQRFLRGRYLTCLYEVVVPHPDEEAWWSEAPPC